MQEGTDKRTGYLCAILSAVLFGLMPLFTKTAYRYGSNAYTVAFMRFFYTTIACGIFLLRKGKASFLITRKEIRWMALLGVFYASMAALLYGSYAYIDSGLASTLHFTYPVVVMLLSALVLRTRLSHLQIFCAVLCMAGIILLTRTNGSLNLRGGAMAVLSGVSLALYVVYVSKSGLKNLPMFQMVFWLSLFTAAYLFVFNLAAGTLVIRLPWQAHAAQFLQAVCCTLLAMVLFHKAVSLIGGVKTALLTTVEPVVGILTGIIVFGEQMTVRMLCGIVLVLLSAILLVKKDD